MDKVDEYIGIIKDTMETVSKLEIKESTEQRKKLVNHALLFHYILEQRVERLLQEHPELMMSESMLMINNLLGSMLSLAVGATIGSDEDLEAFLTEWVPIIGDLENLVPPVAENIRKGEDHVGTGADVAGDAAEDSDSGENR